jgi:hypothetical protein
MDEFSSMFGIDKLCLDFFIVFSRFEYCLKRAGYIIGDEKNCGADWDSFFSNYNSKINVLLEKESFQYLLKNPPKKQVLKNSELAWIDSRESNDLKAINIYLKRIRNNLFHGGKFPMQPIAEPARNKELLNSGLKILLIIKELDEDIKNYFNPEI